MTVCAVAIKMAGLRPKILLLIWTLCILFSASEYGLGITSQGVSAALSDPYCFSFTWLGPGWNNDSQGNGTCDKLKNTPEVCMDPLVITYDSTPPNMTYLWKKYEKREIGCRLTDSEACIKFTYFYNGLVNNITYMCARITVDSDYTMTSGCESATVGNYEKQVCACRTYAGADFPCNKSNLATPTVGVMIILCLLSALLSLNVFC